VKGKMMGCLRWPIWFKLELIEVDVAPVAPFASG
jgi:hypothetical protein